MRTFDWQTIKPGAHQRDPRNHDISRFALDTCKQIAFLSLLRDLSTVPRLIVDININRAQRALLFTDLCIIQGAFFLADGEGVLTLVGILLVSFTYKMW